MVFITYGLYILSCDASDYQRKGLALSIGLVWLGFLPEDGDSDQFPKRCFE
jgi:hypothetical protein